MRLDLKARCGRGRRHVGRDLLDPFERLGNDHFALAGPDRADVFRGDERPRAAPGPRVIRPARAHGDEQHERPVLVGSGPAPGDSVAERVNTLTDLVSSHSSTYLKVPSSLLQPCLPRVGAPVRRKAQRRRGPGPGRKIRYAGQQRWTTVPPYG